MPIIRDNEALLVMNDQVFFMNNCEGPNGCMDAGTNSISLNDHEKDCIRFCKVS